MKFKSLFIAILLINFYSFGQVQELEKFRKEIEFFINYDQGKINSSPKSEANTKQFKQNVEDSFLEFATHKDSRNLDNLKSNSIDNKTTNVIGNHNYFFETLRIDPYKKSFENNVYYQIVLYPIYDYELSNFVSFYIQPFTVREKQYIVYYYKMNGEGTYLIKDISTNKIVFKSQALTSNVPILKFDSIDDHHFLLVEDMGDHGQRALVVSADNNQWKAINVFKGKSFKSNSVEFDLKNNSILRKYLRFASSNNIKNNYSLNFFKQYEITFEPKTQVISYKRYNKVLSDVKKIESKWENNSFIIDDYYLGEDVNDRSMPIPQ